MLSTFGPSAKSDGEDELYRMQFYFFIFTASTFLILTNPDVALDDCEPGKPACDIALDWQKIGGFLISANLFFRRSSTISSFTDVWNKTKAMVRFLVGDNCTTNQSIATKIGVPLVGCAFNLAAKKYLVPQEDLLSDVLEQLNVGICHLRRGIGSRAVHIAHHLPRKQHTP